MAAQLGLEPSAVRDAVLAALGVTSAVIVPHNSPLARSPALFNARAFAIYLCRRLGLSQSETGRQMLRDHSSVASAERRVANRVAVEPELRAHLEAAEARARASLESRGCISVPSAALPASTVPGSVPAEPVVMLERLLIDARAGRLKATLLVFESKEAADEWAVAFRLRADA